MSLRQVRDVLDAVMTKARFWIALIGLGFVWPYLSLQAFITFGLLTFKVDDCCSIYTPILLCWMVAGLIMGANVGRVWAVDPKAEPSKWRCHLLTSFLWSVPFAGIVFVLIGLEVFYPPLQPRAYVLGNLNALLFRAPFLWWFGGSMSKLLLK